ncbi:hypothetical protein N7453_011246 [Penicillium expansum]|nr:hypothetical protein N7453_011246 [Penicillium expansum]
MRLPLLQGPVQSGVRWTKDDINQLGLTPLNLVCEIWNHKSFFCAVLDHPSRVSLGRLTIGYADPIESFRQRLIMHSARPINSSTEYISTQRIINKLNSERDKVRKSTKILFAHQKARFSTWEH